MLLLIVRFQVKVPPVAMIVLMGASHKFGVLVVMTNIDRVDMIVLVGRFQHD